MDESRLRMLGVLYTGLLLCSVPFLAAYGGVGRTSPFWLLRVGPLPLVILGAGAFLVVWGAASVWRHSIRSLTPAVTVGIPVGLLLLFIGHEFAPDPPPIDYVGTSPSRVEGWKWYHVVGDLAGQALAATVLTVAGVATARKQWGWTALALAGSIGLAVVAVQIITPGIVDASSVVASLALVLLVGLGPFMAGWKFARPIRS